MGSIPIGGATPLTHKTTIMPVLNQERERALALRLQGKTYGEIRGLLGVSKSTQSYWFNGLPLSEDTQRILNAKQTRGILALGIFNKIRTKNIIAENELARKEYERKVGDLSQRDITLIGAALYWAEGYKNFAPSGKRYPYIGFSNADPQMMMLFIAFLKNVLEVKKEKMRLEIHIYPQQSRADACVYWHEVTGISQERIKAYVAVSPTSRGKRPKNLLPHGTAYLRVDSRKVFFKVRG